ncbi:MAG: TonB-dependent receptor [Bacteroidales bacterium]|jgi:TonB-linked SusC/RagA family outer membrane protein|nr:TonB-dependent receptor [Bacteroidales bacterium]
MKKKQAIILCFILSVFPFLVQANNNVFQGTVTIKGKILDVDVSPIPGASILIKGTTLGTATDMEGDYTLANVPVGSTLQFSSVGYVTQEIVVEANKTTINVQLLEDTQQLDEVTIVAFGTQKKESVVAAITTISPKNLKAPTSNLTTTFAGQMAGMISYQSSGEPGADNADFFIRGVTTFGYNADPLILVDNIEIDKTELARIQADDIESFSIMKDAAATALYGARGANGVIFIRTKEGHSGKAQFTIRYETTISQPAKEVKLADPVTYMKMHNEAIITRALGDPLLYSDEKIENTELGRYPILYPATNWRDELLKKQTLNQRVNVNIKGGGNVATYYVSAAYSRDNGVLKVDSRNNFNNNIKLDVYSLRSNVNINVTKTTELKVRLDGTFEDLEGPYAPQDQTGGNYMYNLIMKSNPVLFPAYYPVDEDHRYVTHTMFGNAGDGQYLNPYAEMVKGYRERSKSVMGAQVELNQKLDFLLDGLSVRALFNTKREATDQIAREYDPYFYKLIDQNYLTGEYEVAIINPDADGESLSSFISLPEIIKTTYFESAALYTQTFQDIHDVSAQLIFTLRNRTVPATSSGTVLGSLPFRNVGLAGRLSYGYKSRYFVEGNFGYNGSERFSTKHRWGFFPSISAGWMVSNEEFFAPLKSTITQLKFRGSYGLVGNDNISRERFLYLSDVSLNSGSTAYRFGYEQNGYIRPGISISRYADPDITWEVSHKANIAMELSLFGNLDIVWEYFTEKRTNILQDRTTIPYSMGLWVNPKANLGEVKGKGTDLSVTQSLTAGNFWVQSRINFTYTKNKYTKYEDYDYETEWWKLRIGNNVDQIYGYLAEGLFIDDADVVNSPQQFGSTQVRAGDIKYRDLNGDGVISDRDMAPIGYPSKPEIQYGFGASMGYKGFDFSFFFNGLHRRSFMINYNSTSPFFNTTGTNGNPGSVVGHNSLMQFIADDYWSESNRNPYATWPRLATARTQVTHNDQNNTWFLRDGSFLRLKSVELGYTLPERITQKIHMSTLRVYATCNNVFYFSKFKDWDPEMAGNGLAYPIQRTYNLGIFITF